MAKSNVKELAFYKKELLYQDILFKMKFYYSKNSKYETCKIGTINLMPKKEDLVNIKEDYFEMKNMIFGNAPDFDEMLDEIRKLEDEINKL